VYWKLPLCGLWLFYGADCLEKRIDFLHEQDSKFVMKLKYGGKRRKYGTGEWEITTPIIMKYADYIAHEQA
jgi:hypothetical protein